MEQEKYLKLRATVRAGQLQMLKTQATLRGLLAEIDESLRSLVVAAPELVELTSEEFNLIHDRQPISAIKAVQNRLGLSLLEAKDVVDAYCLEQGLLRYLPHRNRL